MSTRVRASRLLLCSGFVIVTGVLLGPFGWLLLTSLKQEGEISVLPVQWVPEFPQGSNFSDALNVIDYLGCARNSLIIAKIFSVLVTLSSAWAGSLRPADRAG